MSEFETILTQYLMQLAHHPYLFSFGVIVILFSTSFGFPVPEEIVLVTSGIVAHMAMNEALETGQPATINAWVMAAVCFASVIMSDFLVFALGRRYGTALLKRRPFNRFISESALSKVEAWTQKYGAFACAVFRFTPGIRFPGHFMCGAMKISYQKFFATDGVAALLTVPTQVLLLAFYGSDILAVVKQFKIGLLIFCAVAIVVWLSFKLKAKYLGHPQKSNPDSTAA